MYAGSIPTPASILISVPLKTDPPAPVVKLVDTRDLKSLGLRLYRFDSGPGHHFLVIRSFLVL